MAIFIIKMLSVEVNNQVQISMKGMQLSDRQAFMESLKERGYQHSITLDVFDVGLLVDVEAKTVLRVMSKKLDFTPGVSKIETIRAIDF